jgi:hypothetical protein
LKKEDRSQKKEALSALSALSATKPCRRRSRVGDEAVSATKHRRHEPLSARALRRRSIGTKALSPSVLSPSRLSSFFLLPSFDFFLLFFWRARRDLNPRPTGSKPGALSN